jgi:predicted DNA-binding transcriptional regulator AlpA
MSSVVKKTCMGDRTIRSLIASGEFPKPVTVSKTDLWVESEIDAWIDYKIAERDGAIGGAA